MRYASTVLPIMREVCAPLRGAWGNVASEHKESHKAQDVVTALDRATETAAKAALAGAFPGIGFAGEEYGGERGERHWLMDPIDGTRRFAAGERGCTSQLALIEGGEPVFGVIYDFLEDRMYWAEKGAGAFCDDAPIHVSDRGLREGRVGWEMRLERADDAAALSKLEALTHLERFRVAGESFVKVATGVAEAHIVSDGWGQDYDFAPGILLVQEAGGIVANIGKADFSLANLRFIAANPRVFTELTQGDEAVFPISDTGSTISL